MKKGIAVFLIVLFALSSLAACGKAAPADSSAAPAPSDTSAPAPITPEDAIAAATTPEELRALIVEYQSENDYNNVYLAAQKLIQLAPEDPRVYQDAIRALLVGISGDYDKIEELIRLCIANAPESANDFIHWAGAQNQAFSFEVPFIHDYASEDEINTVGITPGSVTNQDLLPHDFWRNGILTSQGDWVYFMIPNEDMYVYKMRLDGSGLTPVGDARGDNLNIIGDWLYYKNLNAADMPYRIRTDGTQKEGALFNRSERLIVTQDAYFYKDNGLFRANLDLSETVPLFHDGFELLSYYDGYLYFSVGGAHSEFRRMPAAGSESEKLLNGWMYHYDIKDDWIYFLINMDQTAIQRMRLDGSEQSIVYQSDVPINSFGLADGALVVSICRTNDDRGKPYPSDLIVFDLAAGAVTKTEHTYAGTIYTAKDHAFYYDENYIWHNLNLTTGEISVISTKPETEAAVSESAQQQPQGPSEVGNTSANLFMQLDEHTLGVLAGRGDQIYFANVHDDVKLYSASTSGGSSLKKLLDESAVYVNLVGDTVYYCNKNNDYKIESIGIDGQNRKLVLDQHSDNLSYADGWLYYRTTDGIFKIPAEGGKPTLLLSGKFRYVYATGGFVYYIEDQVVGGLYRIPVDGGEPRTLLNDHPAKFFAIEDNLLYLIIDGGESMDVIRMNLDGSNQKEVFSIKEKIHAINISNHRLIILKDSDSNSGFMALILDPDKYTIENKIDGLVYPCLECVGSDVYYPSSEGFARQNLDTGRIIVISK